MSDQPFARATVSGGRITLNAWHPSLIDGGPGAAALRRSGRSDRVIADLIRLDDGELLVRFVPRDGATEAVRRALIEWASLVGWGRIWLDDRVVDLAGCPAVTGRARVRCPTCGSRWEDERPEFWHEVRGAGWFPPSCPACGGSLPQWEIDHHHADPEGVDRRGRAASNQRVR